MRLGSIALLSGDLFAGQTSLHRQSALPVSTLACPVQRFNCDRHGRSNQSNYCRKSTGDHSSMEIVLSEPLTGFANKRFNTSTWKRFEYSAKESRNANNDTLGEQHWTKAD